MSSQVSPQDVSSEVSQASHGRSSGSGRQAASILIVDDEPGICNFLQRGLTKEYAFVEVAGSAEEAEALCERCHFDLVILDVRLPGKSGIEWLQELRQRDIGCEVIIMTAYGDLDTAVAALRADAFDFIVKPFRTEQMLTAVRRCLEQKQLRRENFMLRRTADRSHSSVGLVGESAALKEVYEVAQRVAPTPSTVLIEGESGTGKELVAHIIHQVSGRNGAFVPVNCAAMSAELMESELFGHTKGAFTGANQAREGLFSYANGGTLFLDEIGEMPVGLQAKLLRVIDQGTMRPVGANNEVPVDVRLVTATNRDLEADVQSGRFRRDLYYRLSVLGVRMPPLRERREDIPVLAGYFAEKLASELNCRPPSMDRDCMERLMAYDWPGNVRELRNVIERAMLLGRPPYQCIVPEANGQDSACDHGDTSPQPEQTDLSLEEVEKRHILSMLEAARGNKSEAARRLRISRKTLERKLSAWGEEQGP